MEVSATARRPGGLRTWLTLLHRWVGLVLAGFLLLAGLTGSLLAWLHEIEAALHPELHLAEPPRPDVSRIDPLVLREQVLKLYPQAQALAVRLHPPAGRSQSFFLEPSTDLLTGQALVLANDEVFVNPYTGTVLGDRRWGDISQGSKSLMPFVYRLHYSLALDTIGQYTLGIIALLWTLDCFVGAWLTFPQRVVRSAASGKRWWTRWRPAWQLRWRAGGHRLNFDLHRAGGLWLWAMLFVLAWSGVAFNLSEVYRPVMHSAFESQFDARGLPPVPGRSDPPALDFFQARDVGRRLMAEQARERGFVVHGESLLIYDAARHLYRYDVMSDRDVSEHHGETRVHFDADSGAMRALWLPTGQASGDTIYTWLIGLHMAAMWGWPMKLFVCLVGLGVAVLSVTGVVIWQRKRNGRLARRPMGEFESKRRS